MSDLRVGTSVGLMKEVARGRALDALADDRAHQPRGPRARACRAGLRRSPRRTSVPSRAQAHVRERRGPCEGPREATSAKTPGRHRRRPRRRAGATGGACRLAGPSSYAPVRESVWRDDGRV